MINMNYTSIEQSKKLLELGLNPESADMHTELFDEKGVICGETREGLDRRYVEAMNKLGFLKVQL